MTKRIVILGAGIVGRLAKIMFPEALVLESKKSTDVFNAELGVQISIVPIPGLVNTEYKRIIHIDNQKPTLELIDKYRRKIGRDGDLSYGDYRQFEHEQVVFAQEMPIVDIQYESTVLAIDLSKKHIGLEGKYIDYDYIISTIPLINLVTLSKLCSSFQKNTDGFFMHRPIYLIRSEVQKEFGVIRENYITDADTPIYRENYFNGWRNQESLFKISGAIKIYPGKIYPNSNVSHILKDLESYKIFCAGRYAQWDNRIHLWNIFEQLKKLREVI